MELGTFEPRARDESIGDYLPAKEAVDRSLIVSVREHRAGIKTKFNQTPGDKGYKPDGGEGVLVDVADINTDEVFIDVLWMNGAVVDNLAAYVGKAVPVKLVWTPNQKGGNPYIGLVALDGDPLQKAQFWALQNSARFEVERAQRKANADAHATQALATLPTVPQAPPAAATPPAPAAPAQALNPNDPAVAALLAQLNAKQAS